MFLLNGRWCLCLFFICFRCLYFVPITDFNLVLCVVLPFLVLSEFCVLLSAYPSLLNS